MHRHDLDHVQVWLRGGLVNGEDGVDNVRRELLSKRAVELR